MILRRTQPPTVHTHCYCVRTPKYPGLESRVQRVQSPESRVQRVQSPESRTESTVHRQFHVTISNFSSITITQASLSMIESNHSNNAYRKAFPRGERYQSAFLKEGFLESRQLSIPSFCSTIHSKNGGLWFIHVFYC